MRYQRFLNKVHQEQTVVFSIWLPEGGYSQHTLGIVYDELAAKCKEDKLSEPHLVILLDNHQCQACDSDILMKSWNIVSANGRLGDKVSVVFDQLWPYFKNKDILRSPANLPGVNFAGPGASVLTTVGLVGMGNFEYASYMVNLALYQNPALQLTILGTIVGPAVSATSLPQPADTIAMYTASYVTMNTPRPSYLAGW